MINKKFISDQPVNKNERRYVNSQKIKNRHEDHYTNGCLLDHKSFKEDYKIVEIGLSKQQAPDYDLKAIQLSEAAMIYFIIEEAGESILHFSQGTLRVE